MTQLSNWAKEADKKKLQKKTWTTIYKFESVKARKVRVKGAGTMMQTEGLHILTNEPFSVAIADFQEYGGSNAGTVIGEVVYANSKYISEGTRSSLP